MPDPMDRAALLAADSSMPSRFPPRPPEEATGPFDGMGDAEDVLGNHGVVRFLFESRQLHIDDIGAFAPSRTFPHQLVHGTGAFEVIRTPRVGSSQEPNRHFIRLWSILVNGLFLVAPPMMRRH